MVRTGWTIHDLDLFPEPLDDTRYEIIGGELYVSGQPHYYHQAISGDLGYWLGAWNHETGAGLVIPAPGIIFAEDDAVAPDIVWISGSRLAGVLGSDGKLHAAPDLVVEVLSPGRSNKQRDFEAKRLLYSRQGVREYWIVDWRLRQVHVYRRQEQALHLVGTLIEEDTLKSSLLPGFALRLVDLFAHIQPVDELDSENGQA